MSAALIGAAMNVGAPLVRQILSGKIGDGQASLLMDVVDQIAKRSGLPVSQLEQAAETDPDAILEAINQVEAMAPEMIALYASGVEKQFALLTMETDGPRWFSAWRPLWMYFLMFLWFWNIVAVHMINAVMKWAVPQIEMTTLLSLTGLFMALYMGGHTLKDFARTFRKDAVNGP
jgi:hypothetical protein